MSQLVELTKPFRRADILQNPSGGGEYVKHSTVTEKLLYAVGPFDYRIIEVIRGYVPPIPPNPKGSSKRAKTGAPELHDAVVGCLSELTLTIDGTRVSVVEVGDCEEPHNWGHDGARLKDASSDALKRCAMRFGVGLHLWSQSTYRLHDALMSKDAPSPQGAPAPPSPPGVGPDLQPAGSVAGGSVGDGKAREETADKDEPARTGDPAVVVESSPTEPLSNTAGNDTESISDPSVGVDGVVRDTELTPAPSGEPRNVPVGGSGSPAGTPFSSARRRLDSAKGHK